MRTFAAARRAWSRTSTDLPRLPQTAAQNRPDAPAPMMMTSLCSGLADMVIWLPGRIDRGQDRCSYERIVDLHRTLRRSYCIGRIINAIASCWFDIYT